MFTSLLKSEIRNVIGLIRPCHSPSQNPAASGSFACATVFAPAAHAARTRTAAATNATWAARRPDMTYLRIRLVALLCLTFVIDEPADKFPRRCRGRRRI